MNIRNLKGLAPFFALSLISVALSGCGKDKKEPAPATFAPGPAAVVQPLPQPVPLPPTPPANLDLLGLSIQEMRLEIDRFNQNRNQPGIKLGFTFQDWETGSIVYVGALQGPLSSSPFEVTPLHYVDNRYIDAPVYAHHYGGGSPTIGNPAFQQSIGTQFSAEFRCLPQSADCREASLVLIRRSASGEHRALIQYMKFQNTQYRAYYQTPYGQPQDLNSYTNTNNSFYQSLNHGLQQMNLAVLSISGINRQFFQLESNSLNPHHRDYYWSYSKTVSRGRMTSNVARDGRSDIDKRSIRISGRVGQSTSLHFRPESRSSAAGKIETQMVPNKVANAKWDPGTLTLKIELLDPKGHSFIVEAIGAPPESQADATGGFSFN